MVQIGVNFLKYEFAQQALVFLLFKQTFSIALDKDMAVVGWITPPFNASAAPGGTVVLVAAAIFLSTVIMKKLDH